MMKLFIQTKSKYANILNDNIINHYLCPYCFKHKINIPDHKVLIDIYLKYTSFYFTACSSCDEGILFKLIKPFFGKKMTVHDVMLEILKSEILPVDKLIETKYNRIKFI